MPPLGRANSSPEVPRAGCRVLRLSTQHSAPRSGPDPADERDTGDAFDGQGEGRGPQVDAHSVSVLDLELHLQYGVGGRFHLLAQMSVDVLLTPALVLDVLHPFEVAHGDPAGVRE